MIRRSAVSFFSSYSTVHTTLEKFGKQFSFTLKNNNQRSFWICVWGKLGQGKLRPRFAAGIWKRSFISTVKLTVHTNPSRKQSISKTHLQTGGIWKRRSCISAWTAEAFENEPHCAGFPVYKSNCSCVVNWKLWTPDSSFSLKNC